LAGSASWASSLPERSIIAKVNAVIEDLKRADYHQHLYEAIKLNLLRAAPASRAAGPEVCGSRAAAERTPSASDLGGAMIASLWRPSLSAPRMGPR
jgi:hypothetical protein